jgi:hypothetical protein
MASAGWNAGSPSNAALAGDADRLDGVAGDLQGWRFRVEPAPGGVRVLASPGGGAGGVVRAGV